MKSITAEVMELPRMKAETAVMGMKNVFRIAPTVLTGITEKSPVMREEIFGPVLPVLTFKETESDKVCKRGEATRWPCIFLQGMQRRKKG